MNTLEQSLTGLWPCNWRAPMWLSSSRYKHYNMHRPWCSILPHNWVTFLKWVFLLAKCNWFVCMYIYIYICIYIYIYILLWYQLKHHVGENDKVKFALGWCSNKKLQNSNQLIHNKFGQSNRHWILDKFSDIWSMWILLVSYFEILCLQVGFALGKLHWLIQETRWWLLL